MKTLITGAAGYIGRHLTAELLARGHAVVGIDRDDGDLTIPYVFEDILAAHPSDVVIHLAAMPGREFCENDRDGAIRSNISMTAHVATACGETDTRLCYVSTSEVYGPFPSRRSIMEDHAKRPINIYGFTKLAGEGIARLYAPSDLLILRPNMPYSGDMPVGFGRAALPTMIWNAMHKMPILVHQDCRRAWCYIDDIVSGMTAAIEDGVGVYNIGRDDDVRNMGEIAKLACEIVGADLGLIHYEPPPATVTPVKVLSSKRLRSLGWRPKVSLENGMKRTYEKIQAIESIEVVE